MQQAWQSYDLVNPLRPHVYLYVPNHTRLFPPYLPSLLILFTSTNVIPDPSQSHPITSPAPSFPTHTRPSLAQLLLPNMSSFKPPVFSLQPSSHLEPATPSSSPSALVHTYALPIRWIFPCPPSSPTNCSLSPNLLLTYSHPHLRQLQPSLFPLSSPPTHVHTYAPHIQLFIFSFLTLVHTYTCPHTYPRHIHFYSPSPPSFPATHTHTYAPYIHLFLFSFPTLVPSHTYAHLCSLHPLISLLLSYSRPHPHITTPMLPTSTSILLTLPRPHQQVTPLLHISCVIFNPLTHSLAGHASSLTPFSTLAFQYCISFRPQHPHTSPSAHLIMPTESRSPSSNSNSNKGGVLREFT